MQSYHSKTVFVVFCLTTLAACAPSQPANDTPPGDIDSFEDCVAAGHPVMESYPEQCRTPDGRTFVNEKSGGEMSDLIRVQSPKPRTAVTSPITVKGEARGSWYFEASFPIDLEDDGGTIVATGHAEAQGEWMTEEFVPFTGTIDVDLTGIECGNLVLRNANPSGMTENEKTLRIPVRCDADNQAPEGYVPFTAYFYSDDDIANATGIASIPVQRFAPKAANLPDSAMRAVFGGPTEEEQEEGALITTDLARMAGYYKGISLQGSVAIVDFEEGALTFLNAAAARQAMAKAAIEATLEALPEIDAVQYSIDGTIFDEWDA